MATNYPSMMGDDQSSKDSSKEYKRAKKRVQAAVAWRKQAKFDETWAKMVKLYANRYDYSELDGFQDVVAPNMVFSTVNVIVPSIAINYPKIVVTARSPQFDDAASAVEAAANYYWRRSNVQDEFRAIVKDFSIIGHGWAKTTWVYETREQEWDIQAYQTEVQQLLMERDQAREQALAAGMVDDFPDDVAIIKSMPKKQTVVVRDEPTVERLSPFDVYVDPDSTRLQNARWIAQRMFIPLEVARERKDWNAKARKDLQPAAMSEAKKDIEVMYDGEERSAEADFVVVWEYYDLINHTVCTFAEGCEDYLAKPETIPMPFEHPFEMVCNYQVPEKLFPIGDVEAVMPLQMELAMTRTQMISDRKRYRRMYMARPDEIGPNGMDAILGSDDQVIIEVESDRDFADIFAPVATTGLPPEFYNQTAMILDDINLVSGVTEYQRGSVAEVRRTATEASMIQDMSNARSADKLAIIERAIGRIADRVVKLAQEFLEGEQVARVVGPDGAADWVQFDRETIQGEYDFEVEAGSTQPQNETFRRQSAMQLMDAMAPFISMGVVDPTKIAEHVMRNGFGIKQPAEFMTQQPPPMAAPQGMPPGAGMPPGQMPPEAAPQGMPPGNVPPEMMEAMMQAQMQAEMPAQPPMV